MILPVQHNRVRYLLTHETSSVYITEPKGWESPEREFARDNDGIVSKFSGTFEFIDDGAEFIANIRDIHGIKAKISLTREERHPNTDIWTETDFGFLSMKSFSKEDNLVKIKFESGGIRLKLESRSSEKIELERTTDLDGNPIPELKTETLELEGRRIFLQTTYEIEDNNNSAFCDIESDAGNTRDSIVGLPLKVKTKSHQQAHSVIPDTEHGAGNGTTGIMFFVNDSFDRELKLSDVIKFKVNLQEHTQVDWSHYDFCLATYENGTDYNLKDRKVLWTSDDHGGLPATHNKEYSINIDETINLLSGESLSFQFLVRADFRGSGRARININAENIESNLTIDENSHFDKTSTKMIMVKEKADRLVHIITGQEDVVYSEALGRTDLGYAQDGFAALKGYAHGQWIRLLDKEPQTEDNKYKPYTTTFKDFLEDLDVTEYIGLGIEKIGFRERIRLEHKGYFWNNNVTIRLGKEINGEFQYVEVSNLKLKEVEKRNYSSIIIRCSKGWENEEAMGLDEYNTQSTFPTTIDNLKNELRKITKYIYAVYPVEFLRRKNKDLYPTDDHRYDKDIFGFDLKRHWQGFKERLWQDDYTEQPTGVFSPETAIKLRYTPARLLLKHARDIAACLIKYPNDFIKFGSSEGNSNLKTTNSQGTISERGNDSQNVIENRNLTRAIHTTEEVEFEYSVDFEILQKIQGVTNILGQDIPNFYGKVEYMYKGKIETGHILSIKPSSNGKWKLIKCNEL